MTEPRVSDERLAALMDSEAISGGRTSVYVPGGNVLANDLAHDLRDARAENAALIRERDSLRAERDTAEDLLAGRLAIVECPSCGEKNMHQWARERRELLTERDSLREHVNALRKELVKQVVNDYPGDYDSCALCGASWHVDRSPSHAPTCLLASTPEQSLAAHDREVVERCVEAVRLEPELEGKIPKEVAREVKKDPERVLRLVVRLTKMNVIERIRALADEGEA